MKKTLIISAIVALVLLLAGYGIWRYMLSPFSGESPVWVYVPKGTDRTALADTLRSSLGERTAAHVMAAYRVLANDSTDANGAYLVKPGDRAKDIARRLVHRRQTPVRVTFNNIRTRGQLAERIASIMEFTPDDFEKAMSVVLPKAGFKQDEFLAAFLPDTYEFYWTTPAKDVVTRLLAERNKFWITERRFKASSLGLSPVMVATLCSIAEEETNNRDERATVGRLYLNRLRAGMKLQADPTVKYAVGDFGLRRILAKHLQVDSPYNTYKVNGLPPGPIRMPERRTMDDFLNAPDNNYLYMCAKEDFSGRHNFARDFATHQANARRYQQALNARGIK